MTGDDGERDNGKVIEAKPTRTSLNEQFLVLES